MQIKAEAMRLLEWQVSQLSGEYYQESGGHLDGVLRDCSSAFRHFVRREATCGDYYASAEKQAHIRRSHCSEHSPFRVSTSSSQLNSIDSRPTRDLEMAKFLRSSLELPRHVFVESSEESLTQDSPRSFSENRTPSTTATSVMRVGNSLQARGRRGSIRMSAECLRDYAAISAASSTFHHQPYSQTTTYPALSTDKTCRSRAVATRQSQLIFVEPNDASQHTLALSPSLAAPEEAVFGHPKTDVFLLNNAGDLKVRVTLLWCSLTVSFRRCLVIKPGYLLEK